MIGADKGNPALVSLKKMNSYNVSVYGPAQGEAKLNVRAASAIEAAKNMWKAMHGDTIGFNYAQNEQNAASAVARDNAHAQWMGGHAGIVVTPATIKH